MSRRPATPPGTSPAMRGALLIAAAVLLGAVLLANGFKDDAGSVSAGNTPTTRANTATTPTSAVVQAHDHAQVKVLVLNGSGKSGVAGGASEQLKAFNYTLLDAGNAGGGTLTASIVYFIAGYDADAAEIAGKLGLPAGAVQPLPTPVPEVVGDPKDANVLVLIGTDAPIAGGAGATTTTTAATTTTAN